jgi:predicted Zn-dependent peptidase
MIMAGEVLDATGRDDLVPLRSANEVLGGSFLSRLNMDLREAKGWSYGVGSAVSERVGPVIYRVVPGPDRPDRPSIAALRTDLAAFLKDKGVAPDELAWATQGAARELPGAFETSAAVLGGLVKNAQFQRPDDYTRLAIHYPTLTAADLDKAARAAIDPAKLTWVVVGDAAKVKPQLDTLGLPVEVTTVTGK